MQEDASKQHEWLEQLLGDWTFEHEATMPGGEKHEMVGKESYRQLGKLWVVGELTSPMPDGSDMTAITTLGYDPRQNAFVGNWVGSPMTHMFIYNGHLDESGSVLTLDTSGPGFEDPNTTADYQDIIEMVSGNQRRFYSQVKNTDGSWTRFMEGTFHRVM